MMKTLIATLVLAVAGFAQGQAGAERPAPTYDDLKTYLSLTDAQLTALKTAHQTALDNAKTYFEQIREKQQSMRSLTDAAAIAKVIAEINALQEKVKAIMEAARVPAVGSLTSAQQAKIKALEEAMALREEIGQAGSLGLLTAPASGAGGPGGGPGFGSRGFGRGR